MPASGNRWAQTYAAVDKSELRFHRWPAAAKSFVPALHDLRDYQAHLDNENNFASNGSLFCTVIEIYSSGQAKRHEFLGDDAFAEHLANLQSGTVAATNGRERANEEEEIEEEEDGRKVVVYRVVICTLEKVDAAARTSFRHRILLSRDMMCELMQTYDVSPQFLPRLLGEPDYLVPGVFEIGGDRQDDRVNPKTLHVFCQHPRWDIHREETALSVYMTTTMTKHGNGNNNDNATNRTTYLLACGSKSDVRDEIVQRTKDWAQVSSIPIQSQHHDIETSRTCRLALLPLRPSPLMLHCMISQVSLEAGKGLFNQLRHRLYDLLDEVDRYAKTPDRERRDKRGVLEDATGVPPLQNVQGLSDEIFPAVKSALAVLYTTIDGLD